MRSTDTERNEFFIKLYQDITDVLEATKAASRFATNREECHHIAGALLSQQIRLEQLLYSIADPGKIPVRAKV